MKTILIAGLLLLLPVSGYGHKKTYETKHHSHHRKGLHRKERFKKFRDEATKMYTEYRADTTLPGKYSMRGKAGPVEDQGNCGSCWDFSLTTVLRGSLIMAGYDPGRLSFNYLLDCATDQDGCDGGDFDAAAWLVSSGQKGDYPYAAAPYTASSGACITAKTVASAASYLMLGQNGSPSFRDIAYALAIGKTPVSIDVAAGSGDWENYSGGIYNGCTGTAGNIDHMVVIEGYDCETAVDASGNCSFDSNGNLPNGIGTWVIRNSWGTEWGDQGYITMKATAENGTKCNAVATDALVFELQIPSPTPLPSPVPSPTITPEPTPVPASHPWYFYIGVVALVIAVLIGIEIAFRRFD